MITEDGKRVQKGDRVFNYYDCEWGVITSEPSSDGWFEFTAETGRRRYLDGSRISTYEPGFLKRSVS